MVRGFKSKFARKTFHDKKMWGAYLGTDTELYLNKIGYAPGVLVVMTAEQYNTVHQY